ncbi:hypothetical protein L7F22_049288 [Adiantum nelumboides]|nr:hypothetical protein [Adiantum nelumboides]
MVLHPSLSYIPAAKDDIGAAEESGFNGDGDNMSSSRREAVAMAAEPALPRHYVHEVMKRDAQRARAARSRNRREGAAGTVDQRQLGGSVDTKQDSNPHRHAQHSSHLNSTLMAGGPSAWTLPVFAAKSGNSYYVQLQLGHPPIPQSLQLDTGSDVTWVQVKPSSQSLPQSDPFFVRHKSDTFRYVECDDKYANFLLQKLMCVNIASSHIGATGVLLDSGSQFTYFQDTIYRTLRGAIHQAMSQFGYNPAPGDRYGLDLCYQLPSDVVDLPILELLFESGISLPLDSSNLFEYYESGDVHCLTILAQDMDDLPNIIGNSQMQGIEWTFDLANEKIAFRTGACHM